jgi:IS30 family transposase
VEQAVEQGRRTRGRRPGGGATDKQERFVRLIEQGVSNSEACRIVEINRRTGTRWRFGRTIADTAGQPVHYPPVTIPRSPKQRHPRYLSAAERLTIADLHREARTLQEIAAVIGRSTSTISRELRRNADPATGRYLPATADKLATSRVARPRARRVTRDEELRAVVVELLGKRWSPEQVAHELRARFPDQRSRQLCTETLYQAIYDVTVEVTRPAKRRRRRRRRRIQGLERRGRLTGMTMIADRPAEVDDRVQVGHWEGDCIMGTGNRSAIGTLVERHTRFLALIHVPLEQPTAHAIRDGICSAMADLPVHLRRSVTWDQGKEMALHAQVTARLGTAVYFCDAHSPWQRGINENANGLLRDYFPKGTDLGSVTPEELARVADEINHRPRKTLDWARPADLLLGAVQGEEARPGRISA